MFNACAGLDLAGDIEQVRDLRHFAGLGAWTTPAVVVDIKVVASGRVPAVAELEQLLKA